MFKKLLDIVLSIIVIICFYFLAHAIYLYNVFGIQNILPWYIPWIVGGIFGLIFYFLLASHITNSIFQSMALIEEKLVKMSAKELLASNFGIVCGLAIANLIGIAFSGYGPIGTGVVFLLNIILGYLGFRVAQKKKDELGLPGLPNIREIKKTAYGKPKILDTSCLLYTSRCV